jgi:hypothetical protein
MQMLHAFSIKSSQIYGTKTKNDSYLGTERVIYIIIKKFS